MGKAQLIGCDFSLLCLAKIGLIGQLLIYPDGYCGRKMLFFNLSHFRLKSSRFYGIVRKDRKGLMWSDITLHPILSPHSFSVEKQQSQAQR